MNTKFTKGPWSVGRSVKTMVFADDGLDLVADCTAGEFARDVEIANAALIAAAPELYEALDMLMLYFTSANDVPVDRATIRGDDECVRRAFDALKKARGEE